MKTQKPWGLDKLTLQCIAMASMLIDHIGAVLLPQYMILRVIGRLAFPIFAFFIAEGAALTHSYGKYLLRVALFAVLTELPFDLAFQGRWIDPSYQNVLWTFAIALCAIRLLKLGEGKKPAVYGFFASLAALLGYVVATVLETDYGGWGVVMVLAFYICRDRKNVWLLRTCIIVGINCVAFGGWQALMNGAITVQSFAVLTLPLLAFYNGQPGRKSKAIQYGCYAFYPVHLLLLGLVAAYLL